MTSYVASIVNVIERSVQAAIGSISPPPVPPNANFPYITVHQIGKTEVESLTGVSGLTRTVIQVNCWHPDYETAFSLRHTIQGVILAFTGDTLGNSLQASNPLHDMELFDGVRELHQLIGRYSVWWES